jgi:hypothetical protein
VEVYATANARVRGSRRAVVKTAGVMVCLLLVVCAAELLVRRFPALMPVEKQLIEYAIHSPYNGVVPDADVGFLPSPGVHRAIYVRDFDDIYETDRKGFPNVEPWPEHPAMVFLGDSMVLGYGVGAGNFTRLVADKLRIDAVNLGVPGAGPERQLAVYRKFAMDLRPRHVITGVYLASDLDNDQRFVRWMRQGKNGDYNTFRLTLAREETDVGISAVERIAKKSWVYVLGREMIVGWLPGRRSLPDRYRFADGSEILLGSGNRGFALADGAPDDPRIDQLLASLEKIRNLVVGGGSTLSVLLIPSKEEIFGVPAGLASADLVLRVRQRLQGAGFSVLDLYPVIRRAGLTRSPYFSVDSHFNEFGQRIIAETFVSWFRRAFSDAESRASNDHTR